MTAQLRVYTIAEGEMERWLREWRERVVPLRRAFGFRVVGAWVRPEDRRFVWIISHDGEEGFPAADRRYYESAERAALDPDPARLIEWAQTELLEPVEVGGPPEGR
jgi:NIPSNAP